jgi:hypothetical protein
MTVTGVAGTNVLNVTSISLGGGAKLILFAPAERAGLNRIHLYRLESGKQSMKLIQPCVRDASAHRVCVLRFDFIDHPYFARFAAGVAV